MAFNGKRPLCCDIVVGTRPEAIKLAPVAIALQQQPERFSARIVTSGQHGEICRSALGGLGLDICRPALNAWPNRRHVSRGRPVRQRAGIAR